MSLRLSILGATGAVGTALAVHVLRSRLLKPGDHLQLVGRDAPDSRRRLTGIAVDLQDAFDDAHVPIETAIGLERAAGDVVVVAAGETIAPGALTRADIAARNRDLFERIADHAATLPDALFVVVSNPVELAVAALVRRVDRRRVIGMGAQQDSLRFARAIAADLGISRHDVHALALGEHGPAMLPLWSQVHLVAHAAADRALALRLEALRDRARAEPLGDRVGALRAVVGTLFAEQRDEDAFALVRTALPDARIFVEPFITARCLHSTGQATANATLAIVAAACGRRSARLAGQVALDNDALGLRGICGMPIHVDRIGWTLDRPERFAPDEQAALQASTGAIGRFTAPFQDRTVP